MELATLDWVIIGSYFVVALGIGVLFARRAGQSMADFFVSGRSLPWWVAGTSMVATTFAVDTPLAVTGLVAKHGLAGNWFWWAFAMGGMFTVFVYARLWRRAGVLTDVELIEQRYAGKPAAFLRGFRSVYVALIVNSFIIGWVTKAMVTVLQVTVFSDADEGGGQDWLFIVVMLAIVGVYSTLSGLWGVVITDLLQFVLAMAGCIALAVIAVNHVGGVDALREQVTTNLGDGGQTFRFLPDFGAADAWMPLEVFLIMVFVQWWATWYPGAEPGGGGYIVQRMASCKDERHSVLATLWFQVAHYCVRPWPWLMVAFVALALHPELREWALDDDPKTDAGKGFPMVMRELAPAGLRGLLLVSFFAAFMSTISTQVNWGASYLVNDVYRRFIRPDSTDRELARASRWASVAVLCFGGVAAYLMLDVPVDQAWKILAILGAGTGAVFMLRWFWWRINAWTEIAAIGSSLLFFGGLMIADHLRGPSAAPLLGNDTHRMAIVAGLTILVWLAVTFLTRPESDEVLLAFYRRVRPGGPGWKPMKRLDPGVETDRHLGTAIFTALVASGIVYFAIPGVGAVIFGDTTSAVIGIGGAIACGICVALLMRKLDLGTASTRDHR